MVWACTDGGMRIQNCRQTQSVNLLDSRATAATWHAAAASAVETTSWHAALWHTTAPRRLVDLHHDRVHDTLNFLLLRFELIFFSELILVQPIQGILHRLLDLLLVAVFELFFELLLIQRVTHCEAVVLEAVFRLNLRPILLILSPELLRLLYHAVNFGL